MDRSEAEAGVDGTMPSEGSADASPDVVSSGDVGSEAAMDGSRTDATDAAPPPPETSTSDGPGCATGYQCVEAPPPGWSGPVELFTGSNPPTNCAAPYGMAVFEGGVGPVADAAACTCGCEVDAATMGCGAAPLVYYNGASGCTGAPCASDSVGAACKKSDPSACSGTAQAIIGQPGTFGGTCAAWVDASAPPWSWMLGALACSTGSPADAGGCAAGMICTPSPDTALCIYSQGSAAGPMGCPDGGPYGVSYVLYGGVDDTRGCLGCSCAPSGTCSGTLLNYNSDLSCSGTTQTLPVPSGCVTPYSSLGGTYWSGSIGLQNPTCSIEGGAPTGAVTQKEPTTFCCTH